MNKKNKTEAYKSLAREMHSALSEAMTILDMDDDVTEEVEVPAPLLDLNLDFDTDWDPMFAAVTPNDCPPATQDVALNLKNRKNAIDTAMYGPLNPAEPNDEYWSALAQEWSVDLETAKQQRCGNCAVFVVSPEMKDCISLGLTGETSSDEFDSINTAGELGYCEAFDFKCASARTCRAWVGGGPITSAAGSRPAPKKEQIKGSKKNAPGSASGSKKITFDAKTETALKNKVEKHNESAAKGRRVTLSMLKAVYRRGAGAYSSSHRPGKTRGQWAMARVNAFLKLVKSGKPTNSAYTTDNDLLPASHPRSSKKKTAILTASGSINHLAELDEVSERADEELTVELGTMENYDGPEDAILALTEFSGLGYDAEQAFRSSWLRAVQEGQEPFVRAFSLATETYESVDADLLPKQGAE